MTKKDITIQLTGDLDARPVAMLVQIASQFDSTVYIETGDKRVNAKSIMGMMSLGMS
nr:HPr family phosphocarrier protein [Lachnospiraceae bacterium]